MAPKVGASTRPHLEPAVSLMVVPHTLAPREIPGEGTKRINGPFTQVNRRIAYLDPTRSAVPLVTREPLRTRIGRR